MRRLFACLAVITATGMVLPAAQVGADAAAFSKSYDNVVINTWFRCSALGGAGTTVTWWTSATNYDDTAHQIDIRIADHSSIDTDPPDTTLLQPGQSFVASATLPWPVDMATVAEVDGHEALATTYIFNTGPDGIPTDTCARAGALDENPVDWGDQNPVVGAESLLLASIATAFVAAGVGLLGLRRLRSA